MKNLLLKILDFIISPVTNFLGSLVARFIIAGLKKIGLAREKKKE